MCIGVAFSQYEWVLPSFEAYLVLQFLLLFWLPVLLLVSFHLTPDLFGLCPSRNNLGWRYGVGLFLLILPFLVISALLPTTQSYYPLYRRFWGSQALSPSRLFYFEIAYGGYLFCWEWFFRGFLLFGLEQGIGAWAILVQTIPFCLLHWGKPWPEVVGSFPAGIVLGFVAWRVRSFIPGFYVHWLSAVVHDLFVLAFSRG